jgi:hypothetical protein
MPTELATADRLAFFSPAWFDMVRAELRAVLAALPVSPPWSLSLIELLVDAPATVDGLAAPYDQAGLRLDIAGGAMLLRRGVAADEAASVRIVTHWDDALTAALMPLGEEYARFAAWRAGAGRLRKQGDIPAAAGAVLAAVHDRVALRTRAP